MNKQDEAFFTETVRDHLETTLEVWMEQNIQRRLEGTVISHLSAVNRLILDHEKRQMRRWKWLLVLIGVFVIANLGLVSAIVAT